MDGHMETLGLEPNATHDDIELAYRSIEEKFHHEQIAHIDEYEQFSKKEHEHMLIKANVMEATMEFGQLAKDYHRKRLEAMANEHNFHKATVAYRSLIDGDGGGGGGAAGDRPARHFFTSRVDSRAAKRPAATSAEDDVHYFPYADSREEEQQADEEVGEEETTTKEGRTPTPSKKKRAATYNGGGTESAASKRSGSKSLITQADDKLIVDYLLRDDNYKRLGGKSLYKEMMAATPPLAKFKLESLRWRTRGHILPKIDDVEAFPHLSDKQRALLKSSLSPSKA